MINSRTLKHKPARLILALVVAFGTLLPFFAAYNLSAGNVPTQVSSAFGDTILICSGEGFKWVKLADLQSGKEKPPNHSDMKCPLCHAASHASVLPPPSASIRAYQQTRPALFAYAPNLVSPSLSSSAHVRAPPVSLLG